VSNRKYSQEMIDQTVKLVLKGEKSANKIAQDLGITPNTICRWVKAYKKEHNLPSYEVERQMRKTSVEDLQAKNRELEKKLKKKERELEDERETIDILKKIYKPNIVDMASLLANGHDRGKSNRSINECTRLSI